ncbi:FeoA family protein [Clostridium botulinum]|uniref:FeoA family protein n=1 Tax=Clostridium botulinum TaxID=1491 RepID=UPI003DA55345
MSICELLPGQTAKVSSISGNEKLVKRLMALGCIEGTEISLKKRAPLGDPILINLRGFDLAIRKKDAKFISVYE